MNNKQTDEDMKNKYWEQEEDVSLVNTINKHLSPRVNWNEIDLNEYPSGRNLISMKERFRRLESFLIFEREQFEIDLDKYLKHRHEMMQVKKRNPGRPFKEVSIDPKWKKQLNGLHYDFMTVGECAEIFRVTAVTIRNMVKRKEIEAIRFGSNYRIPRAEIDKLLK